MKSRPPESPTHAEVPARQRGLRDGLGSPSGQRHRGRAGRARLAGRFAREPARASAAAATRQPEPTSHHNRRRMGFANQVVGGWVGRLPEQWT
eukprot:3005911-Pyramimonas_sp.AAC.1